MGEGESDEARLGVNDPGWIPTLVPWALVWAPLSSHPALFCFPVSLVILHGCLSLGCNGQLHLCIMFVCLHQSLIFPTVLPLIRLGA